MSSNAALIFRQHNESICFTDVKKANLLNWRPLMNVCLQTIPVSDPRRVTTDGPTRLRPFLASDAPRSTVPAGGGGAAQHYYTTACSLLMPVPSLRIASRLQLPDIGERRPVFSIKTLLTSLLFHLHDEHATSDSKPRVKSRIV